jgi:hypothetical protein
MTRSPLARRYVAPRSPAEQDAAARRAMREALGQGYAVLRLREIGDELVRMVVEQEARRQAGMPVEAHAGARRAR